MVTAEEPPVDYGHSSKWLGVLRREAKIRRDKEEADRKAKEARNKAFLESDSDDELDYKKLEGPDLHGYLNKIQTHLLAEEKIIKSWQQKDKYEERDKEKEKRRAQTELKEYA